jgi:hypothetical protein
MNINLLIDAIVRQTTVLIGQLATAAGARAPLAHTANQVFMDLVRELKEQGLGNKVIADMFGLTLRTYHNKVARLSESTTERGRSLWEALLAVIQEEKSVLRSDLLKRFSRDNEGTVRSVLRDLVDSGLVFRTGRGDMAAYKAATPDEYGAGEAAHGAERLANLVWVAVNRYGPIDRAGLAEHVPAGDGALALALERLESDGRVRRTGSQSGPLYECDECVIPLNAPAGWEAAVFDHYQAMVTALCAKLRLGKRQATHGEWIGGSTYAFDVWEAHPHRDEVLGFLQETRERAVGLRRKVERYNAEHPRGIDAPMKVICYVGQTVIGLDDNEEQEQ